ncbi:MAG: phosphate transport system permease protein [Planctomycetota bacterium]|jgi:phosphate transport system permease protein
MSFKFWRAGEPFIWLTGSALALCLLMITGLVSIIMYNGLGVFWPKDIELLRLRTGEVVMGRQNDRQVIPESDGKFRLQLKLGNRDAYGLDFRWVDEELITAREMPTGAVVFERLEWGDAYAFIKEIYEGDKRLAGAGEEGWSALQSLLEVSEERWQRIEELERGEIGELNYRMEDLRLELRRQQLENAPAEQRAAAQEQSAELWREYEELSERLVRLREENERTEVAVELADGQQRRIKVADIVRAYRPNDLSTGGKIAVYLSKGWEFLAGQPRESNTEGGVFPALFGTVMMVMLMSLAAVPFGILAALYLREYARQGFLVRLVRIAVNNLAGVPSIVFGMFGLGFFVYGVGGSIDRLFYAETLPTPTYGTGGILWASLTLALLTVPVVIVATEEALASVPRELREGSLALGSTKFQMIWSVVLPSALPGILTGVILATARGAGEVAPLMITGVVKLAPDLPVDSYWPFFHLERKFMHLGFHIYDVGFQSPNVEAARPMVYTTALLLLLIVLMLNLTAIIVRNKLRRRYATSAF